MARHHWQRPALAAVVEPPGLDTRRFGPQYADEQRFDVYNGLSLSALWGAAFDKGLVSLTDDGRPLASPELSDIARPVLGLGAALPIPSPRENIVDTALRAKYGLPDRQQP